LRRLGAASGGALAFDSNTERQSPLSSAVFCRKHATILLVSGI
jgi:hypothetical protein